jgi:3-deoxy-D-manno-octulosonic-acid transferase
MTAEWQKAARTPICWVRMGFITVSIFFKRWPRANGPKRKTTRSPMESPRTTPFSRRCFRRYNALLLPLLPPLAAYTLWRRFGQGRSSAALRGQWGSVPEEAIWRLEAGGWGLEDAVEGTGVSQDVRATEFQSHSPAPSPQPPAPRIWIHGVSVGEALAARPVARALRAVLPESRIGLSVTTDTGFETAQAAVRTGDFDAAWHFPLDAALPVRRALRAVRPHAVLLMETELWPNFLHLARTLGARTFLVNGRVSDNMLSTPAKLNRLHLGWIWQWMVENLDGLLMRSSFDAERILSLGAPRERVQVTGDVKLDSAPPDADTAALRDEWRQKLGLDANALVWVAGSTHAGEDEIVLRAYRKARAAFPSLRLVLAPRHLERLDEVLGALRAGGYPFVRRTQRPADGAQSTPPVIILDTVGELSNAYRAADVAFVGGSLIPRGGHNVLEPPLAGVPVLFGPHTANFREAVALVEENELGEMTPDEAALARALQRWLGDAALRQATRDKARQALAPHRGAAARVAGIVARQLCKKLSEKYEPGA